MGYGTGVNSYKIWSDGKIILSRNVVFDESLMLKSNTVEIEVGAEKKKVEANSELSDTKDSEAPDLSPREMEEQESEEFEEDIPPE